MRLDLITLLVPDYDDGIAFFTAIGFKLELDQDLDGGKRWVVVKPPLGGSGLLIARAVHDQHKAIGNQAGGRVGFFLHSRDFQKDAERIEKAGGHFEEAPRDEIYGRVAVFTDPFGNRWDLIEPAQKF